MTGAVSATEPLYYGMDLDPADEWLRADALSRPFDPSRCGHEPTCRNGIAHYEREHGIILDHGPAASRIAYHEVTAGLLGQDDIVVASRAEAEYTPERNRKRRRGFHPDGAILFPATSTP